MRKKIKRKKKRKFKKVKNKKIKKKKEVRKFRGQGWLLALSKSLRKMDIL